MPGQNEVCSIIMGRGETRMRRERETDKNFKEFPKALENESVENRNRNRGQSKKIKQ